MKKFLISFLMAFLVCVTGFAEGTDRWATCYEDSDCKVFFDVQTFTITPDESILVWEKTLYTKPTYKVKGKDVYSSLACMEYRKDRTCGIRSSVVYDKKGSIIHSFTCKDDEVEWVAIPPGSVGEFRVYFYTKLSESIISKRDALNK